MSEINHTSEVHIFVEGRIGRIRLNRPNALNALTYEICESIIHALKRWKTDDQILAVLIDGAGDRAFCAGGDIRMMYEYGIQGKFEIPYQFWFLEYQLNALIAEYPKPYIAYMDGIVMGGGVGVSIYGKYRICTDKTLFAMPETGIGYFPDIGASYFLSRLELPVCNWLALTGGRLKGDQVLSANLATHYLSDHQQRELIKAIISLSDQKDWNLSDFDKALQTLLFDFSTPVKHQDYQQILTYIRQYFNNIDRLESLIERLEDAKDEWAIKQLKILNQKAPFSLALTRKAMEKGTKMSLREVLSQDLYISMHFLHSTDFYEGVKAVVIDKAYHPQWNPSKFSEITDEMISSFFQPIHTYKPLFFIE